MIQQTRRSGAGASRLAGYLLAIAAGTLWGTTGPLSTALYAEGARLTDVGFWRVLVAVVGLAVYGLFRSDLFRIDRRGLLVVGLVGGALVALFEVAFQFAIAGVGVAPAVALLYTAPVLVTLFARPLLGEALTAARIAIAVVVMVGVALTVNGRVTGAVDLAAIAGLSDFAKGILGGLLAAASYAGSTIVARYAVPRHGTVKVLFFELVGGTLILALLLPLDGRTPAPPESVAGWLFILSLALGAVLGANFCFFGAIRRIDAAPASVGASVEPVVGALLALLLFGQRLTGLGWIGLLMVVAGVSSGYRRDATPQSDTVEAPPVPAGG